MTKIKARNAIIKILKRNNWYAVIQSGHWGRYFKIMDKSIAMSDDIKNEIYSAIYEEFEDKYDFSNMIDQYIGNYNKRSITWNGLLNWIKSNINKWRSK